MADMAVLIPEASTYTFPAEECVLAISVEAVSVTGASATGASVTVASVGVVVTVGGAELD